MPTNTAHSEHGNSTPRTIEARPAVSKHILTPARAVILTAWALAVLLMLMAIAHVAREQVSRGSVMHQAPKSALKVYASNGGTRLAELEPTLTVTTYKP